MAEHARPHLHTHHRERHHSAIAGAAYRLGLKLFDEQSGKWHDYSKRAGKEVVFGETLGPPGTPAWLLEPGTLWNEVEKAEGRERAQIARDYRIPVPLGLNQADAIAMGKQMAGYIIARFNVPVTLAVHRDNTVDMDGMAKPDAQVGFHCHLYFPTRELVRDGEGEGATWYLGRKLSELSNKTQSAPLVDAMNEKWSVLANRFARAAGLTTVYESMSYARLGLDKTPRPTRARRYGGKNGWFKDPDQRPVDDAIDLTPGLRRKQKADGMGVTGTIHGAPVHLDRESLLRRLQARRAAGTIRSVSVTAKRAKRQAGMPVHGKTPLINRVSFVGGRAVRLDSHLRLAELMRNAGPRPTSDAEQAALERAMLLADFIESLLFAQERARQAQGTSRWRC